jgi:hypothetical protein
MGKLIETLQRVGKSSGGGGMGFLGRGQAHTKARAAGIVVTLSQPDAGQVEALKKAGVDGVLFTLQNGKTGASKAAPSVEPYVEAAASLRSANLPWGLDLSAVASSLKPEAIKTLREGGVDFVSFPLSAPARLIQERPEGLDRVVTLDEHLDDPYMLLARATNLLSVQAVRFASAFSAERLQALTIEGLLRFRLLRETLRFPVLVSVEGDLGNEEVRTLIKLGVSALLLEPEAGESLSALSQRVSALREELERVPSQENDEETPSVGQFQAAPKAEEQPNREH